MSKVIFETSYIRGRYRVEVKGQKASWLSPYEWIPDRTYDRLESAITRAENLFHKGHEYVRVVDTEPEGVDQ